MLSLIAKLFIKDSKNYANASVRSAYGILCGTVGIILNVLLFIGKFTVGSIARSIAVTADAFNNLADAGSSVITLFGFKFAKQKPDTQHPFGHGRIEYISGLLVSAAIILMGFELLKTSIDRIVNPARIEFSLLTLLILTFSIGIKLYMSIFNKAIGTKIHSQTLLAVSIDSASDCIATSVVLVSSIIAHVFDINIDGWCGLLVAGFVIYSGIASIRDTITPLLGKAPDAKLVEKIESLVLSYEGITAIHDLIIHDYGPGRLIISLHAEMPTIKGDDIFRLHDLIDDVERRLQRELGCEATIHLDPVAAEDELTNNLKRHILKIISELDGSITLHDFRIVPGPTHTNLIFDVVVPFNFKLTDSEVKCFLNTAISNMDDEKYYAIITVDRPYI